MDYRFYIELKESKPVVWRRIVVPADYTFYQLHMAIQGAFGWENCHLFQFSENGIGDNTCYAEVFDNMVTDFVTLNARKTKMSKVFKKVNQSYTYIYDFGDYWAHNLTLEKISDEEIYRPFCIEGGGACPPEDVGGIIGYQELLKIFSTPRHPEKAGYIEWLGLAPGEKWDPAFFSIREVNKRMALL